MNPWPATVPTSYGGCMALLSAMFSADRPYSAGDLQVLAQVRFSLGRNRMMTRQHLQFLQAIENRWAGVDQLKTHEARKIAQMEAQSRAYTASVAGGGEL